jgi:hypothetical protein
MQVSARSVIAYSDHIARLTPPRHRIQPRVRDDRDTPLCGVGWRGVLKVFLPGGKARNFLTEGWTGQSLICPSGKICTVSLSRMQGREAH